MGDTLALLPYMGAFLKEYQAQGSYYTKEWLQGVFQRYYPELSCQEELEDDASDSEVEAAKKFVCDFGVFKGKTMEQVLEAGVKGTETLKWIANKYKGPNKELVKAAKTLLDYQSESEELRAA